MTDPSQGGQSDRDAEAATVLRQSYRTLRDDFYRALGDGHTLTPRAVCKGRQIFMLTVGRNPGIWDRKESQNYLRDQATQIGRRLAAQRKLRTIDHLMLHDAATSVMQESRSLLTRAIRSKTDRWPGAESLDEPQKARLIELSRLFIGECHWCLHFLGHEPSRIVAPTAEDTDVPANRALGPEPGSDTVPTC